MKVSNRMDFCQTFNLDGFVNTHELEAVTPTHENVGAGFTPASGRASAFAEAMAGQVKPSSTGVFSR
jgi:hypothetical protein